MTYGPIWPTKPYDPTAIRLYGISLDDIQNEPNIKISFLNEKEIIAFSQDDPVLGLSLKLFRESDIVPTNGGEQGQPSYSKNDADTKSGAKAAEDSGRPGGDDQQPTARALDGVAQEKHWKIAVIYSYAFEGRCYQLDKPKIMVFKALPDRPAIGCGYETFHSLENPLEADIPADLKKRWRMWLVDRLDRVVELSIDQGFFEELILEANKPGKRSPSTYAAHMLMAHRGGRLTE